MGMYRKRTVEVEAQQVGPDTVHVTAFWCGGRVVEELDPRTHEMSYGINVPTQTGMERASNGDYVVKGQHGEFFTCREHAFENDFEEA